MKIVYFLIIMIIMIPLTAFAQNENIDISNAEKGYITINYLSKEKKKLKIEMTKDGKELMYDIDGVNNIPLELGIGEYTAKIYENIEATNYKRVDEKVFTVDKIDELNLYRISISMIDYENSVEAIKIFEAMAKGKNNYEYMISLHEYIVDKFQYDYKKAAENVKLHLLSVDNINKQDKAICYDLAVLFAAGLRSQGVPCKMIFGYRTDSNVYHAWNEVYLNGQWYLLDLTEDVVFKELNLDYKVYKDKALYVQTKTY